MNKKIVALAVASVFAIPMTAQSNATIYGMLDLGAKFDTDASTTALAQDQWASSRFGLRGSEDLGNGLTGHFVLETAINLANQGAIFSGASRGSTLGLSGGFGRLDFGARNLSSSFFPVGAISATGAANYSFNMYAGDVRNTGASVQYTSPNISGLVIRANATLEDNRTRDDLLMQASLVYSQGPLTLGAAYGNDESNAAARGNEDVYYLGAKYDLGMAAVNAAYHDNGVNEFWQLGVSAPLLDSALRVYAEYTNAKNTTTDFGDNRFDLGARYFLSSRTSAYVYGVKPDNKDATIGLGLVHSF